MAYIYIAMCDETWIGHGMSRHEALHDFEDVRVSLNGMLPTEVYEEYYRIAKDQSRSSILELGTGRGASTVAFALGLRDSGRPARVIAIDQFFQNVQGPHPASRKTHGDETVPLNLRAFQEGLRKYGVHEYVDIYVGTTEQVDVNVESYGEVDVLAIDVDGMLDRDLGLFYDSVRNGGLLVLDDYADMINFRGRSALDHYRRLGADGAAAEIRKLSSFHRRRLLGKHLLIFRLTERFEALNLLSKDHMTSSTLFCRKVGGCRFSDRWTAADGEAIEQSIVNDFLRLLRSNDQSGFLRSLTRRLRRAFARGR